MKSTSGWNSFDGTKPCNVCKNWTDGYRYGYGDDCKACANWTEDYRGGNTCKLCKDTKIVNAAKHNCLSCKNYKTLPAKISGNGTNSSGFAGLPAGYNGGIGSLNWIGAFGYWWSSTKVTWRRQNNNAYAPYFYLNGLNSFLTKNDGNKLDGFSVRCLKD